MRAQKRPLTNVEASRFRYPRGHLQIHDAETTILFGNRPRHVGDYLRANMWPVKAVPVAVRRPIHITLHQRQFLEDGGDEYECTDARHVTQHLAMSQDATSRDAMSQDSSVPVLATTSTTSK